MLGKLKLSIKKEKQKPFNTQKNDTDSDIRTTQGL